MFLKLKYLLFFHFVSLVAFCQTKSGYFELRAGNRVIVPFSAAYNETLDSPVYSHDYSGEMFVKAPNSFLNPYLELGFTKPIKRRFAFVLDLGLQYITLSNTKQGWFIEPETWRYYEGTVDNRYSELSFYLNTGMLYSLWIPDDKWNCRLGLFLSSENQLSGQLTSQAVFVTGEVDDFTYKWQEYKMFLTLNPSFNITYSINKKMGLSLAAGLNFVFFNSFKEYSPYSPEYSYRSPYSTKVYRSNITDPHYYHFDIAISYKL